MKLIIMLDPFLINHQPPHLLSPNLSHLPSKTLDPQNRISTMSDSAKLIPNLNEMMKEYAEVEEEVVQETQSRAVQEEERPEVRTETEQPTEET